MTAGDVLFEDDFTGASLDTTKWSTGWFGSGITKPVNGAESACYDPACVSLKNGKLHLKHKINQPPVSVGGKTYTERSGCVTTMGKFETPKTDYAIEARIYLPGNTSGLYNWPAFWTDGTGSWPQTGENDILEGLGGRAAWHYHSPSGGPGGSVALVGGWHDLKCSMSGTTITYLYDGKQVGQLTGLEYVQFIVLANQGGTGSYGGEDEADDMRVDGVKVTSLV